MPIFAHSVLFAAATATASRPPAALHRVNDIGTSLRAMWRRRRRIRRRDRTRTLRRPASGRQLPPAAIAVDEALDASGRRMVLLVDMPLELETRAELGMQLVGGVPHDRQPAARRR